MKLHIIIESFDDFIKDYKKNRDSKKYRYYLLNFEYSQYDYSRTKLHNKYVKLYEIYNNYNIVNNYIHNSVLNEGLIKSVSIEKFLEKINTFFQQLNILGFVDDIEGPTGMSPMKELFIPIELYEKYMDDIDATINNLGYFIFRRDEYIKDNITYRTLMVEPKFLTDATEFIYKLGKLYHITLGKRYNKISNTGLIPKSPRKTEVEHADKVFFFYNKPDMMFFRIKAIQLYKKHDGSKQYIDEIADNHYLNENGKLDIVVLEIDLTNTDTYYKFYYDPNIRESVFTYNTINPKCVDIYTAFEI